MKVLVIGLGSIARKHISVISSISDGAEIFALRRRLPEGISDDGIIHIEDLRDIDMEDIDFVILSNPTAFHQSALEELSKYDKPLFIEKPLFSEVNNSTEELVKKFSAKEFATYVACNLRFLDALIEMKKMLPKLRINEVNVYCGSYLPNWRPGTDFRTVYSANKELGGGVHIDLIHELDYVYWLFGEPQRFTSLFSNRSSLDITAYDYANYLWLYQGFNVSIVLNYYRKDSKRTIEVVAEDGTYTVDLLSNSISINNEVIFQSPQHIVDTYRDQMDFFIHKIIAEKIPFNSINEAYKILKLCLQD